MRNKCEEDSKVELITLDRALKDGGQKGKELTDIIADVLEALAIVNIIFKRIARKPKRYD